MRERSIAGSTSPLAAGRATRSRGSGDIDDDALPVRPLGPACKKLERNSFASGPAEQGGNLSSVNVRTDS